MFETIARLLLVFIAYSLLGALIEHINYAISGLFNKNAPKKAWINPVITGFPLYGFGALFILLVKEQIVNRYKLNVGAEFLLYAGSLTLIELLTGYYVGAGKDSHLANGDVESWDYSGNFLNFDGKIDAFHTLAYGGMGLLVSRIGY